MALKNKFVFITGMLFFSTVTLFLISCGSARELSTPKETLPEKKIILPPIRVLSIDGGGMRGVIPAHLLYHLEKQTKKRTYELFDLIAGTSTGGLLSLLLTAPSGPDLLPKSAFEAEKFYRANGGKIFKYNCKWYVPKIACSLRGPIYDADSMEKLVQELYGDQLFNTTLKPVLLTSFAIEAKQGITLESDDAQFDHLTLTDVARATSAAPTYFKPKSLRLRAPDGRLSETFLIDGGIYKNNPAALAFSKAEKIFGRQEILDRGIILISIGTGTNLVRSHDGPALTQAGAATWATAVIDAMIIGSSNEDEGAIANIFESLPGSNYIRIQTILDNLNHPKLNELDNFTEENLDLLIKAAETTKKSYEYLKAAELLLNSLQ